MATSDEVLVRLRAENQQYLAGMKAAETAAQRVQHQLNVLHQTMNKGGGSSSPTLEPFIRGANRANAAGRNLQFTTSNIVAQFNDIGVTAAMGMNPLLVSLQQGTQLSQAFAGQKLGEVIKGISTSLKEMVGLTSLVTIGGVAAATMLIQWGMSFLKTDEDAKTLKDTLSEYEALLSSVSERMEVAGDTKLAERFGSLAVSVSQINAQLLELDRLSQLDGLSKLFDKIVSDNLYDNGVFSGANNIRYGGQQGTMPNTDESTYNQIMGGAGLSYTNFNARKDLIEAQALAGDVEGVVESINSLITDMANGGPISQIPKEMRTVLSSIGDVAIKTAEVEAEFNGTAQAAREAAVAAEQFARSQMDNRQAKTDAIFGEGSMESAQVAVEAERARLAEAAKNLEMKQAEREQLVEIQLQTSVITNMTQSLGSIYGGITKHIADSVEKRRELNEYVLQEIASAETRAALSRTEAIYGKQSTQYIEQKAAAEREVLEAKLRAKGVLDDEIDLIMAAVTESDNAASATANWQVRMEGVRSVIAGIISALASIGGGMVEMAAINVETKLLKEGKTRAEAARGRAEFIRETAAQERLNSAEGFFGNLIAKGQNWVEERTAQAQQELSVEQQLAAERERLANKKGGGAKRSDREKLGDSVREDIAVMQAEIETLGRVSVAQDRYGNAVERARKEAELLHEAEVKGIPITDELRASVSKLADDWLKVADTQKQAEEEMSRQKELLSTISSGFRSAFDGIFDDPIQALRNFGEELALLALKIAMVKAMPGIFGAGGFADLGMPGNIRWFSSGGYTGAGGVHEPAGIVHKGEVVWSQADIARAGGVGVVEGMRRGFRGYADGGVVGGGIYPVASPARGGSGVTVIDQRGRDAPPIETETRRGPNGEEMITMVVKEQLSRGTFNGAMKSKYNVTNRKVVR